MKVAIYARVSTKDKQETRNQLDQLRTYCETQGYEITKEYVDKESGGSSTRKEFLKLLEHAEKKKFDTILFWSLDRFTREGVRKTLHYLNLLDNCGVKFISYTEPYLNTLGVFGDVVIAMLAVLAKQERIRMSERIKAGIERAQKDGRIMGRKSLGIDKIKLKELKAQKLSIKQIAKVFNCSTFPVWKALKEMEI